MKDGSVAGEGHGWHDTARLQGARPLSRRDVNVGHLAVVSASGRTPSSVIKTTGGMVSFYYIP